MVTENQERMAFLGDQSYTVDDAIDAMGFGLFQVKLLAICGLFTVSGTTPYIVRNDYFIYVYACMRLCAHVKL